MKKETYLKILRAGVYLSFLSIFLLFRDLLFPYITSKQIYFNVLMEVLFVFWLVFIIKYPNNRPKKSLISYGLGGFFGALLLSCFFSVDFNLSFWGDIERMLGVFHLLHFLIFYFIIITVIREKKDWRNLFLVSISAAVLVSLAGIKQKISGTSRINAVVGNSAYIGVYAVFNFYFALILFFKEKKVGIKVFSAIASFLILLALIFSGTRGAYLGFAGGMIVMLLLCILFNKNKKIKIASTSLIGIMILLIILVFANKTSDFVVNNSFLNRLTHISLQDNTMQTRFISWKAAWLDFKNHPLLGVGHGNYAIIFDKYFDPTFYNYTRDETYFDRAHNNLIDIVSTSGLIGLLTYLSIFVFLFYYLLKNFKDNKIVLSDFILITGLIVAYFIQNLVLFDTLVSYIHLIVLLAYVYWLDKRDELSDDSEINLDENSETYFLAIPLAIIFVIIYQFNIKPVKMLAGTIEGQISFYEKDMKSAIDNYKKALAYDTGLDRDSRNNLINAFMNNYVLLNDLDRKSRQDILDYVVGEAEKNVNYNPKDSLMQMNLARLLFFQMKYNISDSQKAKGYYEQAIEAIDKSIEASPGRVPIYFYKAQIYLSYGEQEKAIETLKYAVDLNPDYYDSTCQLAKFYLLLDNKEGYEDMNKCIDMGGVSVLRSTALIKELVNYYIDKDDMERVLKLYQRLSALERDNVDIWLNLAKIYAQLDYKEKAKEAAYKALDLDSGLLDSVENFVNNLENNG